jgi:hypothetical protein
MRRRVSNPLDGACWLVRGSAPLAVLYTTFITSTGISNRILCAEEFIYDWVARLKTLGADDIVDRTGAPMEYLYIASTVLAMAGGTFCFAALQWPRLCTIARRCGRSDRKYAERRDLACRNRVPEFVDCR